ncbi:ABC transporter permease [Actinoalloteichus caeruleus]|uniref:ABC transporter permease n=1 Tax=Actinoalloteichus cyanogriseus TaxID=2893586 RepID=UPI00068B0008|nr:ABC transporter permease [Actinoalloteichus caeruleus]
MNRVLRATGRMTRMELRLLRRDWALLFFGIGFPVVLLLLFANLPDMMDPIPGLDGLRAFDVVMAPIALSIALLIISLQLMPQQIVTVRERGILRRLSTTPAPRVGLLVANFAIGALISVLAVVAVLVGGALVHGLAPPRSLPAFLLVYLCAMVTTLSITMLIAGISRTANIANGIGSILLVPMMFLSGAMVPREDLPELVRQIGDLTPVGAVTQALRASWAGEALSLRPFLVMGVTVLLIWPIAIRFFRWE